MTMTTNHCRSDRVTILLLGILDLARRLGWRWDAECQCWRNGAGEIMEVQHA